MNLSKKEVKTLDEAVGQRLFTIPPEKANDIDIVTGEKCVYIQINGKPFYILVNRPTPIPYNVFCVLKDIGFMGKYMDYEEGEGFNPL